jgi:hypothetical protein
MFMRRYLPFKGNTVFFLNTLQNQLISSKDFWDHLKNFRGLTVVRAPHIPTQYFTQILSNSLNHNAYCMYQML